MSNAVHIVEVGPRDGLQNEKTIIPTAKKIELIDRLSACGFQSIEATSFVSPKWVPQLGDAADVMAGIERRDGVDYQVLTPNMKGYEAARAAKAKTVAVFGAASEGFSQKNINCSIAESFDRFAPILEAAKSDGLRVRGYVSCVIACPYDGETAPKVVANVAERMLQMGCYEISLGDTIGAGAPESTAKMLDAVLAAIPAEKLAGHFHDTGGAALANIEISLDKGLRVFDSAISGLGGCPYAPGAKGNVDTQLVADRLSALGLSTGLDTVKLEDAARFARSLIQGDAA